MPKASTALPDTLAKADMGLAFGRGVHSLGNKVLTTGALKLGDAFLTRRLKNKKKPYLSVRKKALSVAYAVGVRAATIAGGARTIGAAQLSAALRELGTRGRIMAGDCPF